MALKNADAAALQKLSGWFTAIGVLLILFGFIIIIFPVAGTFSLEILLGILLVIAGLAHIVMAFTAKNWGGFFLTLFAGIVYVIVGLLLLTYPLKGIITITLLLGILLLVVGVIKLAMSTKVGKGAHNGWLVFDGIITLLLGILILAAWPSDSIWVVGLLFGIDMLFGGISFLVLSSASSKMK